MALTKFNEFLHQIQVNFFVKTLNQIWLPHLNNLWESYFVCIFATLKVEKNASVAELVDALDSKSCSFGSAGSIPARGTKALD